MDLTCRLNQVLQMCPGKEISQTDKFAMVFILNVDDTPTILTTSYGASVDNDRILAANDSEWYHGVDAGVGRPLFFVLLIIIIRVHPQIMKGKFFLNAFFEGHTFFKGEGIGFSDHGDNIDHIRELLQDYDVNRLESVARGLDEEEAAMDTSILYVAFSLRSEFFSEVA